VYKPLFYVAAYLLFFTGFFGFVSNEFLYNGYDIGWVSFNLIIPVSFLFYHEKKVKIRTRIFKVILIYFVLYLFALLYPVLRWESSFLSSFIASKQFLSFLFLFYLVFHENILNERLIINMVFIVGILYTLVFLLYLFFKLIPPFNVKGDVFQYSSPTLFSLFIFILSGNKMSLKNSMLLVFVLIVWVLGMMVEGHSSIMVLTVVFSLAHYFLRLPNLFFRKNNIIMGLIVFLSAIFLLFFFQTYIINSTPALASRLIYVFDRFLFFIREPIFGYGFLHKNVLTLSDNIYMESLSFIDFGFVDLLLKFGLLGCIFYLFYLIDYFFPKDIYSRKERAIQLFFVQYLILSVTWSPLSFSFGLIPLFFAIYLFHIYHTNRLKSFVNE